MRSFAAAEIQASMRTRFGPAWPLLELRRDKVKQLMVPVYEFVEPIVQTAIERNRNRNRNTDAKGPDEEVVTFLDHLVQHTQGMYLIWRSALNCFHVSKYRYEIGPRLSGEHVGGRPR
jgi:hypothetical protein